MVMSFATNVLVRDFFTEQKHSSTNIRNSLALFVYGMVNLILLVIVIRKNFRHILLLRSHALKCNFLASLLELVIVMCLSSNNAKLRSIKSKWKSTYSFYLKKFIPLNIVTYDACK